MQNLHALLKYQKIHGYTMFTLYSSVNVIDST